MPGVSPDPLYIAARRVLLDALDSIADHIDALVVVGAQAVYLRSSTGDLELAPYTTDADLAIDPARLTPQPLIEVAMIEAGFKRAPHEIGIWTRDATVEGVSRRIAVDLLVPESVAGPGTRSARIPRTNSGLRDGSLASKERWRTTM